MPRVKNEYILYDTKTTLPVAIGTLEECAQVAGVEPYSLLECMSRYKAGRTDSIKWEIYNVDELLRGYDDD